MHDRSDLKKKQSPQKILVVVNKEDAIVDRLFNRRPALHQFNHGTRRSFCGPELFVFWTGWGFCFLKYMHACMEIELE